MNSKIKRKVAEELLMILISLFICFISLSYGFYLEKVTQEKRNKINDLDIRTDSFLLAFRKNKQVDSLLKLQWEFHIIYSNLVRLDSNDTHNYFFWINVRNSIKDSTFNLTYASDEIIKNANDIKYFLDKLKVKRTATNLSWDVDSVRNEFKIFALSNDYERFLPKKSWQQYKEIRFTQFLLSSETIHQDFNPLEYFLYAAFYCFVILFITRYFIYLFIWSIRTLKNKDQ
jgi:hypothetical protein